MQVPDWINELRTKGWAVVSNVLEKEKALTYSENGYKWLESRGLGYDRKHPSVGEASNLSPAVIMMSNTKIR
jgi:hypothetical protein